MHVMRFMKWMSCSAILVLAFDSGSAACADQSPWGPVTGRTNAVAVVHHTLSGDTNASVVLNVRVPDTHRVYSSGLTSTGTLLDITGTSTGNGPLYSISGICDGSWDSTCAGLTAINTCDYASLSVRSRAAIDFLLGPCTGRQCITAISAGIGPDIVTVYSWSCQVPATANCVRMSGTLLSSPRIDLLEQDSGCQF